VYIFLAVVVFSVFVAVAWRFASRRHSLPCPVWLRWMVELDNPFTKTNRAATIIDHLDLMPGMSVVDIGCGPGRLTIPAAKEVGEQGEIVAMDIQSGMLKRAEEKARLANLNNIRFLHGGVGEGKLEQNRFDRVLLVTVLGEIPDRHVAFKEIFDAMKNDGILSITEIIFDPHFQRRPTVTQLAEAVGFREKAFYGNQIAYTIHFEKKVNNRLTPPSQSPPAPSAGRVRHRLP